MTKKITSKILLAKSFATHEMSKFAELVSKTAPELRPDEAIVLAALLLRNLAETIQADPELQNILKQAAAELKDGH